jgi:hypothetical protein
MGNRHDLHIYITDKPDLTTLSDSVAVTGVISFSYEDQLDFAPGAVNETPYDCEAFAVIGDSLLLFTKDWQSQHTSLYTLPARAGDYTARFRKKYDISGLVTAAAYSAEEQELLLLGYPKFVPFTPFMLEVPDFSLKNLTFSGNRRINFTYSGGTQTEGIAYSRDGNVYVSCEKSPLVLQTLFKAEF